jgi:hypothetical protein
MSDRVSERVYVIRVEKGGARTNRNWTTHRLAVNMRKIKCT